MLCCYIIKILYYYAVTAVKDSDSSKAPSGVAPSEVASSAGTSGAVDDTISAVIAASAARIQAAGMNIITIIIIYTINIITK